MKLKYIHYDFNNENSITLEQVKDFINIARKYKKFLLRENLKMRHLQNLMFVNGRNSTEKLFYDISKIIIIKDYIKNIAKICHTLATKYKRYDIIEVLKSTRDPYNAGKNERNLFRHKIDFYKFIAYNLTVAGYAKEDINELITIIL